MRVTQAPSFRDSSASLCRRLLPHLCTYLPPSPSCIAFVPSTLVLHPLFSNCILIDLYCLFSTATTMAVSILGKRTRGAPDLQEQQQHSTRRCTRRTRSFQQGNDENEDPESTLNLEVEDQSESEEAAFFSPSVTRTPSARRTRDIFKFEASDYRGLHPPRDFTSPLLTYFPHSC